MDRDYFEKEIPSLKSQLEQANKALREVEKWASYCDRPKYGSHFEVAQTLEANLAECLKVAMGYTVALDRSRE